MVLLRWIFDFTRNPFGLLNVFLSFSHQPSHYILSFGNLLHFYGFNFYFYERDSQINIYNLNFPLSFSFTQPPACWTAPLDRCFAGISIPNKLIKPPPALAHTQAKLSLVLLILYRALLPFQVLDSQP